MGKTELQAGIQYTPVMEYVEINKGLARVQDLKRQTIIPCTSLTNQILLEKENTRQQTFRKIFNITQGMSTLFIPETTITPNTIDKLKAQRWLDSVTGKKNTVLSVVNRKATLEEKTLYELVTVYSMDLNTKMALVDGSLTHFTGSSLIYNFHTTEQQCILNFAYEHVYNQKVSTTYDLFDEEHTVVITNNQAIAVPKSIADFTYDELPTKVQLLPTFPIRIDKVNTNEVTDETYKELASLIENELCGTPKPNTQDVYDCSAPRVLATTVVHKESEIALKAIGINLDDVTNSICLSPDIDNVSSAYILFGVDLRSDEQVVLQAIYSTIEDLSSDSDIKAAIPNRYYYPPKYGTSYNKKRQVNETITIREFEYRIEFEFELTRESSIADLSDVGKVTSLLIGKTLTLRKIISTDELEQYKLTNVSISSSVTMSGKSDVAVMTLEEEDEDDAKPVVLPLTMRAVKNTKTRDHRELFMRSSHICILNGQIVHYKWYETSIFRAILTVGLLVLNVVTLGASTPLTLAAATWTAVSLAISVTISAITNNMIKRAVKAGEALTTAIKMNKKALKEAIEGKQGQDPDEPVIALVEVVQTVMTEDSLDYDVKTQLSVSKGSTMYNHDSLYRHCAEFRELKSVNKNEL